MSGNVWELTRISSNYCYCYGGCYSSDANGVIPTNNGWVNVNEASNDRGLRLVSEETFVKF